MMRLSPLNFHVLHKISSTKDENIGIFLLLKNFSFQGFVRKAIMLLFNVVFTQVYNLYI